MKKLLLTTMLISGCFAFAQSSDLQKDYSAIENKVIVCRKWLDNLQRK